MTQYEVFSSSQRQNQSFDSLEEEDEEIDVGIEDDSDEEVSKNNSTSIKKLKFIIFSCQQECGSLLVERFRGVRGFGIDELLSHKGTNEVCLMTIYLLLLFVCFG